MFGAAISAHLLKEVDRIRGDIPRSKFTERAFSFFIECLKEKEVALLPDVEVLEATHQAATEATATVPTIPGTEVVSTNG
jgi:hypothetical protein